MITTDNMNGLFHSKTSNCTYTILIILLVILFAGRVLNTRYCCVRTLFSCLIADSLHLYSEHILNYLLRFVDDSLVWLETHTSVPSKSTDSITAHAIHTNNSMNYSKKSNECCLFFSVRCLLYRRNFIVIDVFAHYIPSKRMRLIHQTMQANMSESLLVLNFLMIIIMTVTFADS